MTWDGGRLAGLLDSARRSQSELLGLVKALGGMAVGEAAAAAMAQEVVSSSAIEGVTLDLEAVRVSMLLRLGVEANLARIAGDTRQVDPVVGILADPAENWKAPLTLERIFGWHRSCHTERRGRRPIGSTWTHGFPPRSAQGTIERACARFQEGGFDSPSTVFRPLRPAVCSRANTSAMQSATPPRVRFIRT